MGGKKSDAIQQDVEDVNAGSNEGETEQTIQTVFEEHPMDAQQRIADGIRADHGGVDDSDIIDPVEDTGLDGTEPDIEAAGEDPGAEEPTPEMVKIISDGQEKEVPLDEVLNAGKATLQKEVTADKRLEEASKAFEILTQRAAELDAREAALNMAPTDNAEDVEALAEQYTEALLDGDEDTARDFIKKTLELNKQLSDRLAGIEQNVNSQSSFIEQKQKDEQAELNRIYHEDYNDISSDKRLNLLAQQEANTIRMANPGMPEREVQRRSCESVREWAGTWKADNKVNDPELAKAKLKKPIKRAGGRTPAPEEPKRKTASDIIAEIKARNSRLRNQGGEVLA